MISKTNIFLIGPMGSGKTTVGKALAKALDLSFVDSDAEVERRTGIGLPNPPAANELPGGEYVPEGVGAGLARP